MKRIYSLTAVLLSLIVFSACKPKSRTPMPPSTAEITDLSVLVNAVPNSGPRTGNNYKVFFKALRQNQAPAVGFKVEGWVKGKSEPRTLRTDQNGIVKFEDLPFPDSTHWLNVTLHYYKGKEDMPRDIDYPYLESDAYRLKDTQYIPNTVTPDPQ